MTHTCNTCGKSAPEAKFCTQGDGRKLRTMCNVCRHAARKKAPTEARVHESSWAELCADSRPDWGWNKRYVPTNDGKSKEFRI